MKPRRNYDPEFKKMAVDLSHHRNDIGKLAEEQKEITRLKKELREAKLERNILKKAVSILSKSDGKYSGS